MKKQTHNTPVTKDDLTEVLQEYPTKEDLDQRLTASHNAFRNEIDFKFQSMKEDIKAEFSKFTNLILTTFDPLLQELETRQQDREIATAQTEEIRSLLDNHEKRILKLEHS